MIVSRNLTLEMLLIAEFGSRSRYSVRTPLYVALVYIYTDGPRSDAVLSRGCANVSLFLCPRSRLYAFCSGNKVSAKFCRTALLFKVLLLYNEEKIYLLGMKN